MKAKQSLHVLKPKNLDDPAAAWKRISDALGPGGKDLHTISHRTIDEKRYFHASAHDGVIDIDRAREHQERSRLTGTRRITFADFSLVAAHYNDYALKRSTRIRSTASHNSSYIITLIACFA
jgi:hypothetical protein